MDQYPFPITFDLRVAGKPLLRVKAVATLTKDGRHFEVGSFKELDNDAPLPIPSMILRYVAETVTPGWIEPKYNRSGNFIDLVGKAIEITNPGKAYIAKMFLDTIE